MFNQLDKVNAILENGSVSENSAVTVIQGIIKARSQGIRWDDDFAIIASVLTHHRLDLDIHTDLILDATIKEDIELLTALLTNTQDPQYDIPRAEALKCVARSGNLDCFRAINFDQRFSLSTINPSSGDHRRLKAASEVMSIALQNHHYDLCKELMPSKAQVIKWGGVFVGLISYVLLVCLTTYHQFLDNT
jgi:hypothetical protein